jgi:nucleotide-binding universal stress UspA family protein
VCKAQTQVPIGVKRKNAEQRLEEAMSLDGCLRTIVVATDLSGQSEAAFAYARKIAAAYGARIVLAHGLDPVEYAAVNDIPRSLLRNIPEEARAGLAALSSELLAEGIPSHSEMRQGAVAQMLVDVTKQYEAGLIVIGTKGLNGAGPVVVGAIAEQLVRLAPCPVLAVAADWNAGEFRPTPGGPVLLAMERNEAMQAAMATAHSLAESFQRKLIVVHARGPAEAAAFLNPGASSLKEFGIVASKHIHTRFIVKDGIPTDAINEAIAQYRPSILVVGAKRTSETPGAHGTAFAMLSSSRVPVLCVPAFAGWASESETLLEAGAR